MLYEVEHWEQFNCKSTSIISCIFHCDSWLWIILGTTVLSLTTRSCFVPEASPLIVVTCASCTLGLAALEDGYLSLLKYSSVPKRKIWVSHTAHIWSQNPKCTLHIFLFFLKTNSIILCHIPKTNTLLCLLGNTGHFKAGNRWCHRNKDKWLRQDRSFSTS